MSLMDLFRPQGREGCFYDTKLSVADVAVICHELRGVDMQPGDQAMMLVQDGKRSSHEASAAVGSHVVLRNTELDSTLFMRILQLRPARGGESARAVCGELRLPLPRIGLHLDGVMYQTWLELDAPGLASSVGSIGADETVQDIFAKESLLAGAQRLSRPRVCLSVCRAQDVGPNGRLVLGPDAPPEQRAARWAALLMSQQQHAMMSVALHAQGSLCGTVGGVEDSGPRLSDLRRHVDDQAREIAELRGRLFDSDPSPTLGSGLSDSPQHKGVKDGIELERARAANERKTSEVAALRGELEKVSCEANGKIDLANERIRELKRDRDEARDEAARMQVKREELQKEVDLLRAEMQQLAEDKENLLGIVEDLHKSCDDAGLHGAGRKSIDNTLANFRIH